MAEAGGGETVQGAVGRQQTGGKPVKSIEEQLGYAGQYIILGLFHIREAHGYRLAQVIEQVIGVDLPVATLYTTLKRLRDAGLINVLREEVDGGGPPRKVYGLSGTGVASARLLQERAARIGELRPVWISRG